MRLLVSLATLSASGALLLASTPAHAWQCPRPTYAATYTVGGTTVTYCTYDVVPDCDPGSCDLATL